jgi:hypothetical protein
MTGIALFELAHWRAALLLCPNVFESWFLYVLMRKAWFPQAGQGTRAAVLAAMIGGKLGQEWLLHGVQVLDRYNLDEVLRKIF